MRSSNWTWKMEYLYVDLGSLNIAGAFSAASPAPGTLSPLAGTVAARSHLTDNILRVGFSANSVQLSRSTDFSQRSSSHAPDCTGASEILANVVIGAFVLRGRTPPRIQFH